MPLEILTADGKGAERWSLLIEALPADRRDVHFLPEYGRIYRDTYRQDPFLAVYEEDGDAVLQPFVRRPLAVLPFLKGFADAEQFTDIANPYGYGGPLCTSGDSDTARRLYRKFADHFAAWCEREDIASEFTSLHPLLIEHQLPMVETLLEPRFEKEVVVMSLDEGEAAIRSQLSRGHKSNIAKARRAGVTIAKVEACPANLAIFNGIYYGTMQRHGAADRWFVPDSYFANCIRNLGEHRTSLFFARVGDTIESAYLLMHDFATAYYHFGGTRALNPEARANNLLMYECARWARGAGFNRYHLGGGVTRAPDDSLFRFKAGFSGGRAPLHVYFCVRDAGVYDDLSVRKRRFERMTRGAEMTSDFLPVYRR